jgi:hypothetical protein
MYVRNCFSGVARSDVARRTPYLATQPELGLLPERRTGLGSGNSGCPAFAGQDLSRGTLIRTRLASSAVQCGAWGPVGYDSRAERLYSCGLSTARATGKCIKAQHRASTNRLPVTGGALSKGERAEASNFRCFRHTPLKRGPRSLGAVLNAFTGLFNVLAKAVGSVAAGPDNSQECGEE